MKAPKRSSSLPKITTLGIGVALLAAATLAPVALPSDPALANASDGCTPSAPNTNCVVYTPTGADQVFTVLAGVTSVTARVAGAGGGVSVRPVAPENSGGAGGLTLGTIAVTGGQTLAISVGDTTSYGGGGTGGPGTRATGGHGGGLSAIWSGASFASEPYLLAGGGGGAAGAGGPSVSGGVGGGLTGGNGVATQTAAIGGGGSQTTGGAGGNGTLGDGSKYQGGSGVGGVDGGGGGGGGWFGGGAGHAQPSSGGTNSDSGGGGGSGYIGTGTTGASMTTGGGAIKNTSGTVLLEWVAPAPTIVFPAPGDISSSTPTITGTGVPGNTVTVTEDGVTMCTAVAATDGKWSCVPNSPLTAVPGGTSHTIIATQTDDPSSPLSRYPASPTVTFTAVPPTTFTQPSVPRVKLGDNGATGLRSTVGEFTKYVITAPTWVTITGYSGCVGSDYLFEIAPDGSTATCTYTSSVGIGLATNNLETLMFTVSTGARVSASLAGSITVSGEDGTSRSFPVHVNTPPVIPVLTGPASGSVVTTSTPPITGTGQDGDIVTVTDENHDLICTTIVTGGIWSCTPTTAVTDGNHTFTPTAEDPDGNMISGTPVDVTVDTAEPVTPAASGNNGGELSFTGAKPIPLIGTGFAALLLGAALLLLSAIRRRRRA